MCYSNKKDLEEVNKRIAKKRELMMRQEARGHEVKSVITITKKREDITGNFDPLYIETSKCRAV